jgi:predicted aspartyl protease
MWGLSVEVFLVVSSIIGRVTLTVGGWSVDVEALFDTGATRSFVNVGVAEKLGYTRFDKPREVLLATRDSKAYFVGELVARVTIEGFELPLSHVFGVISGLRYPVIIGLDIMEPYEIALDVKTGKAFFKRFPSILEIV